MNGLTGPVRAGDPSGATVGIDVGGTDLKAVAVAGGRVLAERRSAVDPGPPVLEQVAALGASLAAEVGAEAVGVGVAGLVRWPRGEFVWGPHVAGVGIPYRAELERRLRLPVAVDNDANAAAHAELAAGAAQGFRHAVVLTLGTGIGAGLVVDGRVYRGRSFAGEVGHVTLQPDGLACACGRRGCWETLVSGGRLDREAARQAAESTHGEVARAAGGGPVTARHLVEAAGRGDPAASAVLAEAGRWLGLGIASLVAVLDPEVVVIGGGAAAAGDLLFSPARAAIASHVEGGAVRDQLDIVPARFGALAGAVGAALLARDRASGGRPIDDKGNP